MSSHQLFDELKLYVRFDARDQEALQDLRKSFGDETPDIATEFYSRILEHPEAAAVLTGGEAQLDRLKVSLQRWLLDCLEGPWDRDYFERHARIGRRHVEVGLRQHFMFVAMSLVRNQLCNLARQTVASQLQQQARVSAVNKLLDLELAIMLHTYREDYTTQVQEHERRTLITQLLPAVARELHNPLTVVDSSAYLLQQQLPHETIATEHLAKIRAHAQRASRIAEGMLELARERLPMLRPHGLKSILEGVIRDTDTGETDVELHCAGPHPVVDIDPQYAEQILGHLLRNAVQASPGGRVRIEVSTDEPLVSVVVSDDGPGVSEAILTRLFAPLATDKSGGAGLGLALSRALAQAQGGTLDHVEGPLPGASFRWQVGPPR